MFLNESHVNEWKLLQEDPFFFMAECSCVFIRLMGINSVIRLIEMDALHCHPTQG